MLPLSNGSFTAFLFLIFITIVSLAAGVSKGDEDDIDKPRDWPVRMTLEESKHNLDLGQTLLTRIYARMDHLENLIRHKNKELNERLNETLSSPTQQPPQNPRDRRGRKGHHHHH